MAYPLDNLGDYNVVINDLKEADGNVEILYKNIKNTAVAKEKPRIFKEGCLTGTVICAAIYGVCKYYKYKKDKKKALQTESKLKDELIKTVETSSKTEIEETYSSELKK